MRRVVVIGTSGSGKTTLARAVANRLGVRHAELDELHWGPGWTPYPDFLQRVQDFVAGDAWVIDGHYGQVRSILWARADTIVWLDYPMRLVFNRVLRRTMVRGLTGVELWNGNRERLWKQFFSTDSLLLWVIQTWRLRRAEYPRLFASAQFAHTRRVRLRSPIAAERWLATVPMAVAAQIDG